MINHPPTSSLSLWAAILAPIHANSVQISETVAIIIIAAVFFLGALFFFVAAWYANKKIDRDKRKW